MSDSPQSVFLVKMSSDALQALESKALSRLCARHFWSVSDGLPPVFFILFLCRALY